jgi:nucleoside-diphosphate kinase
MELEQSLVLIKPDALQQSMTGVIITQLSGYHTGLAFAAAKIVEVSRELAKEHYAEHKYKPFFNELADFLTGKQHYLDSEASLRRVEALVYFGKDAIKKIRKIAGPTNPEDARLTSPGSIRSMGSKVPIKGKDGEILYTRFDNLVHASADTESAEKEIKLWFKPEEIPHGLRIFPTSVSKTHFYYKNGQLSDRYLKGSVCIAAPGDILWKSDLKNLDQYKKHGGGRGQTLESTVLKYFMNKNI